METRHETGERYDLIDQTNAGKPPRKDGEAENPAKTFTQEAMSRSTAENP